jgi:hypothetical protein
MSVTAARDGLEDILADTGVNVYRRLTDVVDPPAAVIQWPETIATRVVFGSGEWDYEIPVLLCVSYADPDAADRALEALLLNTSGTPLYALENGGNLSSAVDSTSVLSIGDFGTFEAQGITLFGCRVLVGVLGG